MKLGEFFTLKELCKTSSGHENHADRWALVNLARLVALILDPLRGVSGALRITSGFRSPEVNKSAGGSDKSYHLYGLAADVQSDTYSTERLMAEVVDSGLPFDKIINEFDRWMHIQIKPAGELNRGIVLRATKDGDKTVYQEM